MAAVKRTPEASYLDVQDHLLRRQSSVGARVTGAAGVDFRRHPVVVGFTDDPAGIAALKVAVEESNIRGIPLSVVHGLVGVERPPAFGPDATADREAGVRRRAIFDVLRRLNDVAPDRDDVEVRLVTTPVEDELTRASTRAELVVVGVTSRSALAASALDTVPRNVVKHAACPVMLVPAGTTDSVPRLIVCGVDRTPAAAAALRWAAAEADLRGLTVLAFEARPPGSDWESPEPLSEWVRAQHPDAETTVVCRSEATHRPARALVEVTSSQHGLLVVGRHQRGTGIGRRSVAGLVSAQTSVRTVLVPRSLQPAG